MAEAEPKLTRRLLLVSGASRLPTVDLAAEADTVSTFPGRAAVMGSVWQHGVCVVKTVLVLDHCLTFSATFHQ